MRTSWAQNCWQVLSSFDLEEFNTMLSMESVICFKGGFSLGSDTIREQLDGHKKSTEAESVSLYTNNVYGWARNASVTLYTHYM